MKMKKGWCKDEAKILSKDNMRVEWRQSKKNGNAWWAVVVLEITWEIGPYQSYHAAIAAAEKENNKHR